MKKIIIYCPLGQSHQGTIDYIDNKSTYYTNTATTFGCPSMVTLPDKLPLPHIIPSYENSISSEPPLHITTDVQSLPPPPTEYPTTEPSDETLHKNSVEPLSIRTLHLVNKKATNLPPVPPSQTPEPCKNRAQFESLNLHRIFGGCRFRNQKHFTAETNASLFK